MDRNDFQRILTLTDTIHDFKASDRGKLDKNQSENISGLYALIWDELSRSTIGTASAQRPMKQEAAKKIRKQKKGITNASKIDPNLESRIKNDPGLRIDLIHLMSSFDDGDLPDYAIEYALENNVVTSEGGENSTLLEFLYLMNSPQNPYNPARLIEMLMLTYIHDGFRQSLGLKARQNYIDRKDDCSKTDYIRTGMDKKLDASAKSFCENIYYGTYVDNSIFCAPTTLEDNMRKVLLHNLKMTKEYKKDDGSMVKEWESAKAGDFGGNPLHATIYVGSKERLDTVPEGIYALRSNDPATQADEFQRVVELFYGAEVFYAYDSNGLENDWMKSKRYKGKFVDFDSYNQDAKGEEQQGGMPPKRRIATLDDEEKEAPSQPANRYNKEFQTYVLNKSKNELIVLDKISVIYENKYLIQRVVNHNVRDISTQTRSKGLPLFLKFFDEINKKTLGYRTMPASVKSELLTSVNNVGLEAFRDMYRITLEFDTSKDADSYVKLSKDDFIGALFDIKRSMDYLYVKATLTANMRQKLDANKKNGSISNITILPNPQKTKFVFVTRDKSAVWYALSMNVPCILTSTRLGGKVYMELFNPEETYHHYDEIIDEYKNKNVNNVGPSTSQPQRTTNNRPSSNAGPTQNASFAQTQNHSRTRQNAPGPSQIRHKPVQTRPTQTRQTQASQVASQTRPSQTLQRQSQIEQNDSSVAGPSQTQRNQASDNVQMRKEDKIREICREIVKDKTGEIYSIMASNQRLSKPGMKKLAERLSSEGIRQQEFLEYIFSPSNPQWEVIKKTYSKSLPSGRPDVREIRRNIWDRMSGGGGSLQNVIVSPPRKSVADEEIPIDRDLTSICEIGSPFHSLLSCYSRLSPSISFFWFVVFKTLMYVYFGDDMDKADCAIFVAANTGDKTELNAKTKMSQTRYDGKMPQRDSVRTTIQTKTITNKSGFHDPWEDLPSKKKESVNKKLARWNSVSSL